jgi:hypothetical protein
MPSLVLQVGIPSYPDMSGQIESRRISLEVGMTFKVNVAGTAWTLEQTHASLVTSLMLATSSDDIKGKIGDLPQLREKLKPCQKSNPSNEDGIG